MKAREIALTAVMIAMVTAVVVAIGPIPIGTVGYFNLSDVAIYFAAFAFGPVTGFLAGGVGTALADVYLNYAAFAPLSFLAHGIEGLLAGAIGRGGDPRRMVLGWAAGTVAMVGIYFLGEYFGAGLGWGGPPQAVTEWPGNLLQNVIGGAVAIPLVIAVRRAYPPLAARG